MYILYSYHIYHIYTSVNLPPNSKCSPRLQGLAVPVRASCNNVPPYVIDDMYFLTTLGFMCLLGQSSCLLRISTSLGEVFPVIPTSPISISLDMASFVNINIAWSDLVGNIINPDRRSTSTQVQTILSLMLLLDRIQEMSLKRYQNI